MTMTWAVLILLVQSVHAGGQTWSFGPQTAICMPGAWGFPVTIPGQPYLPDEISLTVWSRDLRADGFGWSTILPMNSKSMAFRNLPAVDAVVVPATGQTPWLFGGWGPRSEFTGTAYDSVARYFLPGAQITVQAVGARLDKFGNLWAWTGPYTIRTMPWWRCSYAYDFDNPTCQVVIP